MPGVGSHIEQNGSLLKGSGHLKEGVGDGIILNVRVWSHTESNCAMSCGRFVLWPTIWDHLLCTTFSLVWAPVLVQARVVWAPVLLQAECKWLPNIPPPHPPVPPPPHPPVPPPNLLIL